MNYEIEGRAKRGRIFSIGCWCRLGVGKLAPIEVEILCLSRRVGKDWSGKREHNMFGRYCFASNYIYCYCLFLYGYSALL